MGFIALAVAMAVASICLLIFCLAALRGTKPEQRSEIIDSLANFVGRWRSG